MIKINRLSFLNAALITIVAVTVSGQVQARSHEERVLSLVEESKREKFIVKGVNGGLNGNALVESLAKNCASDGNPELWRNADNAGKARLMDEARVIARKTLEKYDNIGVRRSGLLTKSEFGTFAPKGTIKLGDQIIAKAIPVKESPFAECPEVNGYSIVLGIDRVIKSSEVNKGSGSGNAKASFLD